MMGIVYEKRPLKRPRLGPPDVYPQEPKQKEDELTPNNVKHGFTTSLQLSDEHGTARNCNVTAAKVGAYFNAILAKKEELATMPDTGRKRQQINPKDNFWPVTARTKNGIEAWFKDLSGCKPLVSLAKKAPNFNKKEEIFTMLCEYQVPMLRAAWFIKLSSAYTVAVSEAKIKKRQLPDPTTEWTGTLIKFLKDQLVKMQDYYYLGQGPNNQGNSTPNNTVLTETTQNGTVPTTNGITGNKTQPPTPDSKNISCTNTMSEEHKLAFKQWHYCIQLAKYMFEEGLLDRQEFLQWILELLDKLRSAPSDDGILKLLLPLALQYLEEFVQSELLARRLAYLCCRKIAHMCANIDTAFQITPPSPAPNAKIMSEQNGTKENQIQSAATPVVSQINSLFNIYLGCQHHRDVLFALSAIIQVITLECPTALVWNNVGEGKSISVLNGSPLDHLPCPPSALPSPPASAADPTKRHLKIAQENIKARSQAAESRWSCDKWQQSSAGMTTTKVLATLDALDRHSFDRMDSSNSLDTLYAKIFTVPATSTTSAPSNPSNLGASSLTPGDSSSKNEYNPQQDAAIIEILCEWAVSAQRWGEHRAMAVAKLLEKRQTEASGENSENDDKDSVCSNGNGPPTLPIFQGLLMKFLDVDAPVLDSSLAHSKVQFTNLVHLFSELIRHDVFSHDAYMCTLISRGDLIQGPAASKPNTPSNRDGMDDDKIFSGMDMQSNKLSEPHLHQNHDQMRGTNDYDDSKIDDDLDKILQDIKDVQQNSMDAPDSPKDPDSLHVDTKNNSGNGASRHLLYTTHFPLPQDETCSQHDCNQRHVLLYGVGRVRDEARHVVKKMTKEVCKLFGKKFSIDVAEGGKVKKHSRSEFNFEAITQKFQNLSYFDQHVVTWQCATQVVDMLNTFVTGSSYLPVQEHVAFLFDLMELALNIYGLIDICIQILKELPDVEAQLDSRKSTLVRSYTTNLSLYIVGVLRRYHCCLLLSPEQTMTVFSLLCKMVAHVSNPSDCSSAERCILAHLHDLYSNCSLLKTKPHSSEGFNNANPKIRAAYYTSLTLTPSNHVYNSQFMVDILNNPRRGGKIEPQWAKTLNDRPADRYSFVCNAIVTICSETDNDKLNDIAITCAELTACCNSLNNEWLGVLSALCCSSGNSANYLDVTHQVDVTDLTIHNSLAVFTSILIARHCFSLEDFVRHIAIPSLVKACNENRGDNDNADAEAGARLTCHLLLRLFKTVECPQPFLYSVSTSPHPLPTSGNQRSYSIKLSCDRHLLAAAHNNISVGPLIAVLKAILVVGDATAGKQPVKKPDMQMAIGKVGPGSVGGGTGELSISHILGTTDIHSGVDDLGLDLGISSSNSSMGLATESVKGLSDFAQHVLRQICSQEWVLERCLQNPEELCQEDMLLDNMLTPRQAQRLLHMICYPDTTADAFLDQKTHITNILENLEQWSLRMSWLDLQLMYKHCERSSSTNDLSQWLDTVAKAAIDVFQLNSTTVPSKTDKRSDSIWLVAPLVSKLPSAVQGRVLKVAGQVLESGNWSKATRERRSKSPSMFNHQPFLSLVLTCLKGQDDQREGLLTSLHSQLSQFCTVSKDDKSLGSDDPKARECLQDALQLRFSLVGGVFDTIQRNITVTNDWAMLLVQLVSYGVIDLNNNAELFTTVIDMLATLIHSTLVSDSQSEKDENKKYYQNLMKKLKKELGDKNSQSIQFVRQLLPLPKVTMEIITCEQVGCITDTKGNKIAGFNSIDKKQGLQVYNSQRVSAWELLEGHKNPAPLSWAWFRAVRLERKPLTYQSAHKLLRYHTHNQTRPASHYLDPLPLPPEDLEPDKKDLEPGKADTPMSIDSPSRMLGIMTSKGKNLKNKRHRRSKATTPTNTMQPQQMPQQQNSVPMQSMQYGGQPQQMPQQPGMFPNQPQPQPQPQAQNTQQQWYPNQQAPHPQAPQQYPYPPQMGGPRYDRPGALNQSQSKQALTNMLRLRLPSNQFMNQQQGPPPNAVPPNVSGPAAFQGMRNQFIRQQLRTTHGAPPGMQPQQQTMFAPQQQQPQQQQNMYPSMQQGMNQNYTGYGGQQMMTQQQQPQQQQTNMMAQQQANMFQNQQQIMGAQSQQQMMNAQNQQQQMMNVQRNQEYLQQQRMQSGAPRPPYMQQAPNVTMNTMGTMGGNVQNQPAPPYRQTGGKPGGVNVGTVGQPNVGLQPNQHMASQLSQITPQQRMRQLMAMQQQQAQQQQAQQQAGNAGQQATPQLVAHLQRSLTQVPHPYQHQPPPYAIFCYYCIS